MKTNQSGFNLIELLIVIVIIALLAVIAMPSFDSFIRSSRLANVRSELAHNGALLERYYAQKSTFIGFEDKDLVQNEYFDITFMAAAKTPAANTPATPPAANQVSGVIEEADNTSNPSDAGYILQAAPNSEYADKETCTVFMNDSGIFWAVNKNASEPCPGYEEPHQP